jgi:hypothetical protein
MRRLIETVSIAIMALALSAPVAEAQQRSAYRPFVVVCDRDYWVANQALLNRALDNCLHTDHVRISATSTTITVSFDPAIMPLIGVGPGRPPKFQYMPMR